MLFDASQPSATQYSLLITSHSALFPFLPHRRSIPAMRTGVLVIAIIVMLIDWGGQRQPARSATLWTEDSPVTAQHSSHSFATEATILASSNSTSEMRKAASANGQSGCSASAATNSRLDFDTQIKPIFQSKCMPCHFSGGVQYEKLPFDRPETIKKLGTKLFTRIQDENHRRLIREFLAQ